MSEERPVLVIPMAADIDLVTKLLGVVREHLTERGGGAGYLEQRLYTGFGRALLVYAPDPEARPAASAGRATLEELGIPAASGVKPPRGSVGVTADA